MKTDSNIRTASKPPSLQDLKECNQRAREFIGHPELYSWKKENKPTYLLTVTYGSASAPPTWILHAGDGENAAVVWVAMTSQPAEILTRLKIAVEATSTNALSEISKISRHRGDVSPPLEQPSAVLVQGAIFADNYKIMSQLGQGGMGIVYKSKQMDNGELVALKVLHPHLITDNISRTRFEQEAQKSGLSHPNLIRIRRFGFAPGGQPFIAMDYLEGCPLAELLAEGPLSLGDFKSIFSQVCKGLFHAHSNGVIHRDIKPSNIMICKKANDNTTVKIVDFGIAKSNIAGSHSKLTPTGEVLGSPAYMSPEQCAGSNPDPRSDIYSLGVVMFEAATGSMPFIDANPIKLLLKQISERAPNFIDLLPDGNFSREQEKIVMKALAKDVSLRYQSAEELLKDLSQLKVADRSDTVSTAVAKEVRDSFSVEDKSKKKLTLRFRKFKVPSEKDLILRGLDLSKRLLKKGADISIYLDYEASHLAHRANLMAPEFHPDFSTTEKIKTIHAEFQKIIKAGGQVVVSEYWLRYYGILAEGPGALISGILVLNDDAHADYMLLRTSTFLDYT